MAKAQNPSKQYWNDIKVGELYRLFDGEIVTVLKVNKNPGYYEKSEWGSIGAQRRVTVMSGTRGIGTIDFENDITYAERWLPLIAVE